MNRPARLLTSTLAVLYFASHCVLTHAEESNYWKEKKSADLQLASLPTPIQGFPTVSRTFPSALSTRIEKVVPKNAQAQLIPLLKTLSSQYGSVRSISIPAKNSSQNIVVHIQDVHLNAEAQQNMGRTVENLINEKKVNLLALEGAFGPVELSSYRAFPDKEVTQVVGEYLLRTNRISGPVHAALTSEREIAAVVGVDEKIHYDANVNAYRESLRTQKSNLEKLKVLQEKNQNQSKDLNPALHAFHSDVTAYRAGKNSIGDYVRVLSKLNAEVSLSVELFLDAVERERSLNFSRVEAERALLLSELMGKLSADETNQLLDTSVAYKSGQVTHSDFYRSLQNLCVQKEIKLPRYKAMDSYIHYVLLSESIQVEKLMADVSALEKQVYASLIQTAAERNIIEESKEIYLVGKLLDFSLTPEEWQEFKKVRRSDSATVRSEIVMGSFVRFYEEAEARNDTMVDNLLKTMQSSTVGQSDRRTAVLVTGGFHAPGINSLLTGQGITVISFVPKITKVDSDGASSYLSVFAQEKTPLDQLFKGEKLFTSPDPRELSLTPPLQTAVLKFKNTGNSAIDVDGNNESISVLCETTQGTPSIRIVAVALKNKVGRYLSRLLKPKNLKLAAAWIIAGAFLWHYADMHGLLSQSTNLLLLLSSSNPFRTNPRESFLEAFKSFSQQNQSGEAIEARRPAEIYQKKMFSRMIYASALQRREKAVNDSLKHLKAIEQVESAKASDVEKVGKNLDVVRTHLQKIGANFPELGTVVDEITARMATPADDQALRKFKEEILPILMRDIQALKGNANSGSSAKSYRSQVDLPPLEQVLNNSLILNYELRLSQQLFEDVTAFLRGKGADIRFLEELFERAENRDVQYAVVKAGLLGGNQMARYFDAVTKKVTIAIDADFYHYTIGGVYANNLAAKVIFMERLFHELAHDNKIGTFDEELQEEIRVMMNIDWRLWKIYGNSIPGLQSFLDETLRNTDRGDVSHLVSGSWKYREFQRINERLKNAQARAVGSILSNNLPLTPREAERVLREELNSLARLVVSFPDLPRHGKSSGGSDDPNKKSRFDEELGKLQTQPAQVEKKGYIPRARPENRRVDTASIDPIAKILTAIKTLERIASLPWAGRKQMSGFLLNEIRQGLSALRKELPNHEQKIDGLSQLVVDPTNTSEYSKLLEFLPHFTEALAVLSESRDPNTIKSSPETKQDGAKSHNNRVKLPTLKRVLGKSKVLHISRGQSIQAFRRMRQFFTDNVWKEDALELGMLRSTDGETNDVISSILEAAHELSFRIEKTSELNHLVATTFTRAENNGLKIILVPGGMLKGNNMLRYFDQKEMVGVLAIDEDFYLQTIGRGIPSLAGQIIFMERFLHELRHDNIMRTEDSEIEEELDVLGDFDFPLWEQVTRFTPGLNGFLAGVPSSVSGKWKIKEFDRIKDELDQTAETLEQGPARQRALREKLRPLATQIVTVRDFSSGAKNWGRSSGLPLSDRISRAINTARRLISTLVIWDDFRVTTANLKGISTEVSRQIQSVIVRKNSESLKMFNTFAPIITGKEKGIVITNDFGGSNGRVRIIRLNGDGTWDVLIEGEDVKFTEAHRKNPITAFHDMAAAVRELVKQYEDINGTTLDLNRVKMSLAFAYPLNQTGLGNGILTHWDKEWEDPENGIKIVGQDVGQIFSEQVQAAFRANGRDASRLKVKALINDTLNAKSVVTYQRRALDPNTLEPTVSSVGGTGHNTAITINGVTYNMESGAFDSSFLRQLLNEFDVRIDLNDKPGKQRLEKLTAASYMAQAFQLVVEKYYPNRGDLSQFVKLNTLSKIFSDRSLDLATTNELLKKQGFTLTQDERRHIQAIARIIVQRSASLVAAELVGALRVADPQFQQPHVLALEGSMFNDAIYRGYTDLVRESMRKLIGDKVDQMEFVFNKGAEGIGAAILALASDNPTESAVLDDGPSMLARQQLASLDFFLQKETSDLTLTREKILALITAEPLNLKVDNLGLSETEKTGDPDGDLSEAVLKATRQPRFIGYKKLVIPFRQTFARALGLIRTNYDVFAGSMNFFFTERQEDGRVQVVTAFIKGTKKSEMIHESLPYIRNRKKLPKDTLLALVVASDELVEELRPMFPDNNTLIVSRGKLKMATVMYQIENLVSQKDARFKEALYHVLIPKQLVLPEGFFQGWNSARTILYRIITETLNSMVEEVPAGIVDQIKSGTKSLTYA